MKSIHRVIIGDVRKMMELADRSVDLIITSPPYWQLKDYGVAGQIGFHQTYEEYINHLNLVWKEAWRVLANGCRLCINIGDQFARSVYYGRYKVIPIRTEIIKFCEAMGFDYMGAIIWQKVATTNTTGGATIMGSYPYPKNGILKIDYEFILIFKKPGHPDKKISKEIKDESKLTKAEWNDFFSGHWNFSGVKQEGHLAMFPLELPYRLIKMFSFVGEMVLDPFLGSGTTIRAAIELNRNSVGYEINSSYLSIIKKKLGISEMRLFNKPELRILQQQPLDFDFKEEIQLLPYIFKDTIKIDKKIDPKKMNFGSKIDENSPNREEFFSIKEVISPEIITLNTGIKIKLIGVRENKGKNGQAISFLREILNGQKVFLKFDEIKYDKDNNLLCYLYLKNKTFINAHLIKKGFVSVETGYSYKLRDRFLKIKDKANA